MLGKKQFRRGAAVVETALVLSLCLLFLFGIFEYGRFLLTLHVMENATREGARFAVAHTGDRTRQDVVDEVRNRLAGINNRMENFSISVEGTVLRPDAPGENIGDALAAWSDAGPTDGVAIEINADYIPVLPNFLLMGNRISLRTRSIMYSEGN